MGEMVLIIGGACQGKLDFALRSGMTNEKEITDGALCDLDLPIATKTVTHLHLLIKRYIERGGWNEESKEHLLRRLAGHVVICDEVGCGVVPIERTERLWREETGRFLCCLAQNADEVFRVICGIGRQIKGERND